VAREEAELTMAWAISGCRIAHDRMNVTQVSAVMGVMREPRGLGTVGRGSSRQAWSAAIAAVTRVTHRWRPRGKEETSGGAASRRIWCTLGWPSAWSATLLCVKRRRHSAMSFCIVRWTTGRKVLVRPLTSFMVASTESVGLRSVALYVEARTSARTTSLRYVVMRGRRLPCSCGG